MKQSQAKAPPGPIPRSDSLLHRLLHAPAQEGDSYLDQLMIFLDDPPAGVGDRWKQGAEMCSSWGISCTGASVWRLYRSYVVIWRSRPALEAGVEDAPKPALLDEKAAEMAAFRTCEILTDPDSSHASLVSLARLELRKKALEFARKRHEDNQRTKTERAIEALKAEARGNKYAEFTLCQLLEALKRKPPTWQFPFLPTTLDP
jgi:hypothetical protein